ncbi:MAG: integrase core domain-containing protein [Armatimonadetes bacterium]|nr:integrase core domain-containing protein [Armatimonadota bacterium]
MLEWLKYIARFIRSWLASRQSLVVENLALRSQLALFEHQVISGKRKKPKATPAFRQLWTVLSRCYMGWKSVLVVFEPDTIIRWHDRAFRLYWKRKSKPKGRPTLSKDIIDAIKQVHEQNLLWSPERIHDQLVSLGLKDVPCAKTIAKYIPDIRKPPSEKSQQSWRTFLANHKHDIWAMDFMTVPTLTFKILYVLVIISHKRREIKHIAVTAHPTADWTTQQLREATPFGEHSKYVIHDNDPVFRSEDVQQFLADTGIEGVRTGYRRPDQNGVCERFIGILRRELIDHIIPFDERHLYRLLKEYIDRYYHCVRTHSSLDRQPILIETVVKSQSLPGSRFQSRPILGGLYHSYEAKAA